GGPPRPHAGSGFEPPAGWKPCGAQGPVALPRLRTPIRPAVLMGKLRLRGKILCQRMQSSKFESKQGVVGSHASLRQVCAQAILAVVLPGGTRAEMWYQAPSRIARLSEGREKVSRSQFSLHSGSPGPHQAAHWTPNGWGTERAPALEQGGVHMCLSSLTSTGK
ncbi:unnamed protein product, partial [Gulo gulo]